MWTETEMLRHVVATIAYRGGKTLRDALAGFGTFRASGSTRTPIEILSHIGDLLDWARGMADGYDGWNEVAAPSWEAAVARFYDSLAGLDGRLASGAPLGKPAERIFQGPLADALTHLGQIAILRRMSGSPVRGESYYRAEISAGVVGPEQPAPRREFD